MTIANNTLPNKEQEKAAPFSCSNAIEERVRQLLVQVCGTEDVLADNVDLLESGLLDSFAFIELLTELELDGVSIQPTQVDRQCFCTVAGIVQLVQKHLNP